MDPSSAPWRVVDAPAAPSSAGPAGAAATTSSRSMVVLAAGGIALLLGAAIVVGTGGLPGSGIGGGSVIVAASDGAAGSGGGATEIVVDVAGAVMTPGVYRLAPGSRVGDALSAAGGFGPRVDAVRAAAELNLAAVLEDEARIVVPSRDDPTPSDGDAGSGGGSAGRLVDLNTATQAELEALPGIGPVTATKIIDSRADEPFTSVDDLRTRKLVGAKTFESLRDLVTVR
ncbi:MAG: ComEA family DNA-binding protein [Chloroflexi bacterium]|nr:ComEA family DNA-binding protein [Chloroflexota bacterium]